MHQWHQPGYCVICHTLYVFEKIRHCVSNTTENLEKYEFTKLLILWFKVSGHLVITSSLTGRVYFWNKTTGEAEAGIQAHAAEHPINAMDIHDGRLFTASG